ncbi:hypothetical protein [Arthrobacter sp. A5]|uniref:hypothetical protein n=1 Tax=Arthrobacter sp. A5 TaxID=576926 RepID=UPI003DAA35EB
MFLDRSRRPSDAPEPPTPDEIAAGFAVPLLTLAAQDSVEEASAGISSQTQDHQPVMEAATLSYTLWRNPSDRDDPANLVDLTEEMRAALDAEPPWPLPEWISRWRARMCYPLLWDAVRTTHISEVQGHDGYTRHTPELALVEHINYIVRNTYRDVRVHGGFPGELIDPASEDSIEHGYPVSVGGADVVGLRVDSDPHVLGLAADLDGRLLTAVIGREYLPYLRLAFATRPSPARP